MSVKGLPNIGLSCYINSVLQAFFYIDEIKTFIMETDFVEQSSFVFYLQCVFKILNGQNQESLEVIFSVFKSFCEKFMESKQGDANHFLIFLLNKLDLEIKNNFDKTNSVPEGVVRNNRNIITDLFRGEQEDRVFCEKCNNTEDKKTKQNFFSLPIVPDKCKDSSIEDLLMNFFAITHIQNVECPECGGVLCKHTIVTRWPTYLIINICRSQLNEYCEMIKVNSKVLVENEKLTVEDLSNIYSNQNDVESNKMEYKLQAAINHIGTPYSGHYTCTSFTNFLWLEFNDELITFIEEGSVISNNNNLLIFKKVQHSESS